MQQLCEKREYFRKRMKIGFAGKKQEEALWKQGAFFCTPPMKGEDHGTDGAY